VNIPYASTKHILIITVGLKTKLKISRARHVVSRSTKENCVQVRINEQVGLTATFQPWIREMFLLEYPAFLSELVRDFPQSL
jgi:hypothetical protein